MEEEPERRLAVALIAAPGRAGAVSARLTGGRGRVLPRFDLVLVGASGAMVQAWAEDAEIRAIDIVADAQARHVERLLGGLDRIGRLADLGMIRPGVLNISIGPNRAQHGRALSGERAIRHAIATLLREHGLPVVMSAGNDGPLPGLVNAYALAPGTIIVAATDVQGTRIWEQSSRFAASPPPGTRLFAAHGLDTIGARAGCTPKTAEEEAAAQRARLRDIVGPDREACYGVRSGTSFAAASVTRAVCPLHQAVHLLLAQVSAVSAVGEPTALPAFVRAYIDSGFDLDHPEFANRIVGGRSLLPPLAIALSAERKQQAAAFIRLARLDVHLRYDHEVVAALLGRAARPVPGGGAGVTGAGFIDEDGVARMLRQLRYADLPTLFGRPGDDRGAGAAAATQEAGDAALFAEKDVTAIVQYCRHRDLTFGIAISTP